MDEVRLELARAWFVKALHDLGTARKAAADPDPYLDTAVYHCQQAGEKAVKAFLTLHDVVFEKTHNLGSLVALAADVDSSFQGLADAAEALTPYATLYRYPSDLQEPTPEEYREALGMAETIVAFVRQGLPPEASPSQD